MEAFYKPIYQLLSTNGDGTGTTNANGTYSVGSPGTFYIEPPPGQEYVITRMIVLIEDTAGFSAEEYGNLGSALTNGIIVRTNSDSKGTDNLTTNPITSNAEWGSKCYDVDLKTWGAGDEIVLVRWTFAASGISLYLDGDDNSKLEVICQDTLTGLVQHTFNVQGYNLSLAQ